MSRTNETKEVGQITADVCQTLTTNLTQYDSHGPDDHPKTIDYHHLDMSRDDGMDRVDEHGIDSPCGCHLVADFGSEVGQITADVCQTL
jgi:hypothetical protein